MWACPLFDGDLDSLSICHYVTLSLFQVLVHTVDEYLYYMIVTFCRLTFNSLTNFPLILQYIVFLFWANCTQTPQQTITEKKKKKKKKKKKQQKKGLMSVIGTTTIGGNEKMGMLPLWLVETVYLARLCADRFALWWILWKDWTGIRFKSLWT